MKQSKVILFKVDVHERHGRGGDSATTATMMATTTPMTATRTTMTTTTRTTMMEMRMAEVTYLGQFFFISAARMLTFLITTAPHSV